MTSPPAQREAAHRYHCVTKRCREYHRPRVTSMSPGEFRQATGSFLRCESCGQALRWLPPVPEEARHA